MEQTWPGTQQRPHVCPLTPALREAGVSAGQLSQQTWSCARTHSGQWHSGSWVASGGEVDKCVHGGIWGQAAGMLLCELETVLPRVRKPQRQVLCAWGLLSCVSS